ncbi:two-component system C4-dicarboxylate transport response regulator DctD [Rhodobacter sp. JA431]|uniref:sigma-54-dependent transcriptional regulator n=1 Tax=Rhodobacter sp. JA431 TaxID=570013 RepID=UPI000BDD35D1|nr:sigma-54 dependent transcriptional regulator [Rhodobacter sp. JA431]SOC04297.1 two-component system C4-dicarboxylate transport response regulator DctD [Rhodobacter sp. JA431]
MSGLIHVVEDDADHRAALCDLIEAGGYCATGFAGGAEALEAPERPDLLITDLRMPQMDGFGLLDALKARQPDLPVVLITGHGDVPHAVRAIRSGAEDFLEKPYDAAHLLAVVGRGLRASAMRREIARLQAELDRREGAELLGQSAPIRRLRQQIAALAPLGLDIILRGETGTGKELIARALHAASPRATGPFVALNCAALPEALFEIEVFGHAEGAFPGAREKPGKLELASGGTLVLDEIEALPASVQPKLLRVLQERQVERLGEHRLRTLDLRIVALTKTDLRPLTLDGGFRADLFYRLAGAEIVLEPLRALGEDIPLMFAHFAERAARRHGGQVPPVGYGLRQQLLRRPWPGNVRELQALAERFALGLDLPEEAAPGLSAPESLTDKVAAYESREISAVLERCRGNTERAAQMLGIARRTLNDKMRRYGL